MDNKPKQTKAGRILYIGVIAVLCVMAVIVAVTATLSRRRQNPPAEASEQSPSVTTAAPEVTTLPEETEGGSDAVLDMIQPDVTSSEPVIALPETSGADISVEATPEKLPDFTIPANGTLTKTYCTDTAVFSLTMNDFRTHNGIDIGAPLGSPVYAAADGVISQIWEDPLMGSCLSVAHSGGAVSMYMNLSPERPLDLEVGTTVRSGQLIGAVGESAIVENSEEPHLHYELSVMGELVNPLDYIDSGLFTQTDYSE